MESEETQDCMRANDLDHEESEELSFVPSAINVLQKPLFVVTIITVRRPSSSGSLRRWRSWRVRSHARPIHAKPLTKWQWHEFVEKKAHRGSQWKMMGNIITKKDKE